LATNELKVIDGRGISRIFSPNPWSQTSPQMHPTPSDELLEGAGGGRTYGSGGLSYALGTVTVTIIAHHLCTH
jgi:hypothetical protein